MYVLVQKLQAQAQVQVQVRVRVRVPSYVLFYNTRTCYFLLFVTYQQTVRWRM